MDFVTIMNSVFVILLMIMIGYICKKLGYMNKEVTRGVTEILLNIAIPAIAISSFNQDLPASALSSAIILFIFAVVSNVVSILLGTFLFKKYPTNQKVVMQFIVVFTNCGFMGYPVMESIFGSIGVFYASIYCVVFNLFLWTYGLMLFTGVSDWQTLKKALVNPGTLSTVFGLVLLLTPLELPAFAAKLVTTVGGLTTPLAMIVIGAMLAEVKFSEMFQGIHVYYGSFLRLLVLPATAFLVLKLLHVDQLTLAACVMLTAMPPASNTVIFAEKFERDSLLASKIVVLSTGLSIITIPLFAMLVFH
ncbi:MAG: AEC family transporter [Desulfosporosinus sp.]